MTLKRRRPSPARAGGATVIETWPDSTWMATGPASTTLSGPLSGPLGLIRQRELGWLELDRASTLVYQITRDALRLGTCHAASERGPARPRRQSPRAATRLRGRRSSRSTTSTKAVVRRPT